MFDKILYFLTGICISLMKGYDFLKAGAKEFYAMSGLDNGRRQFILGLLVGLAFILSLLWPHMIWLFALAPVAFIQNMLFTLVSRSRNSQDTDYHRFCAWGSNGVWFVCQVMIVKNIWSAIGAGNWWYVILAGIVYSLATTEGSVFMMKRLIKTETGKRRVGANDKIDKLEERLQVLERINNRVRTKSEEVISKLPPLTYRSLKTIYRHGGDEK